jgi:hypothetical protein
MGRRAQRPEVLQTRQQSLMTSGPKSKARLTVECRCDPDKGIYLPMHEHRQLASKSIWAILMLPLVCALPHPVVSSVLADLPVESR